jgi:hypothetical protein
MGRLLVLYMWNRQPFLSARDLEMVRYAMQYVAIAVAVAPHWEIIGTYWNTAMEQNNIWSRAFKERPKEIKKEVC